MNCYVCGRPEAEGKRTKLGMLFLDNKSSVIIGIALCGKHDIEDTAPYADDWRNRPHKLFGDEEAIRAVSQRETEEMDVGEQAQAGQKMDEEIRQRGTEDAGSQETQYVPGQVRTEED